MNGIVDGYGRPIVSTKEQVEARQKAFDDLAANRGHAFVTSMLPGPNPALDADGVDGMPGSEFIGMSQDDIHRIAFQYQSGAYGESYARRFGRGEEKAGASDPGVIIPPAMFNERFMKATPISELNIPKDSPSIMNLSMRYAEDNYIVSTGIRIKKNFALKDMTLTGSATAKQHYKEQLALLNFRRVLNNTFRYYWSCGRIVVYWGEERPLKRLRILDPRFIKVQTFLGAPFVFLRPDPRWRTILELGGMPMERQFLLKQLPAWWIPYILADRDIPLKEETYALIENDLSLFPSRGAETVGGTPLSAAFVDLSIQRMLLAGDFSVAWMMKNMIGLVSIGDPEKEPNWTRSDIGELSKLQQAFQRPDYALWAYVDPTVNIRYITPDPKLLSDERFQGSASRIERVMAIPSVFSANGDKDFSTGSLQLKWFREEIQFGREDVISQLTGKLFPILREGHSRRNAGTQNAGVEFDNDCLVDDRVLLEMNNGKFDRGALSVQSLLENKAQDIETERVRKQAELEEVKARFWTPAYDTSHGTVGPIPPEPTGADTSAHGGPGGRPLTTGKPNAEGSSGGQTPRPSRS